KPERMIAPFDTRAACGNKTKEVADPPDHLVVAGLSVEAPRELPDVVRRQLRPGVRREDVEKAVLRWSQPDRPAIDADLLVDAQLQRMDQLAMADLRDDGDSVRPPSGRRCDGGRRPPGFPSYCRRR